MSLSGRDDKKSFSRTNPPESTTRHLHFSLNLVEINKLFFIKCPTYVKKNKIWWGTREPLILFQTMMNNDMFLKFSFCSLNLPNFGGIFLMLHWLSGMAAAALSRVGGFEALRFQFQYAASNQTYRDMALYGNRSCGVPPERAWHIFHPATDSSYPWPGMVFGMTILALNYWCMDQVVRS